MCAPFPIVRLLVSSLRYSGKNVPLMRFWNFYSVIGFFNVTPFMFHFNYAAEKLYMVKYPSERHYFVYLNGLVKTFFPWNSSKIPLFLQKCEMFALFRNFLVRGYSLLDHRTWKNLTISANTFLEIEVDNSLVKEGKKRGEKEKKESEKSRVKWTLRVKC